MHPTPFLAECFTCVPIVLSGSCLIALKEPNQGKLESSRFDKDQHIGRQARVKAGGRIGEIVGHHPEDKDLTYKLKFLDGEQPQVDWFAAARIAVLDATVVKATANDRPGDQDVEKLKLKIDGIDYDKLVSNPALTQSVKEAIKEAVIEEAGDNVEKSNVHVELSKCSEQARLEASAPAEDTNESQRVAGEEESRRNAAEEAEAIMKAAEEKEIQRRNAEKEEAQKRAAEEEARRITVQEEEARKAVNEAEAKRKAAEEQDAQRRKAEEEAEEARRKALEEEEHRRKTAEEEEAQKGAAEEEARRIAVQEEEAIKAVNEAEAKRKAAEEHEAQSRRAEEETEEARRKALEEEERRRNAAEEKVATSKETNEEDIDFELFTDSDESQQGTKKAREAATKASEDEVAGKKAADGKVTTPNAPYDGKANSVEKPHDQEDSNETATDMNEQEPAEMAAGTEDEPSKGKGKKRRNRGPKKNANKDGKQKHH